MTISPDGVNMSYLVHAVSKAGKSTLTSTAPRPLCVLDAEGSWKFIDQIGFQSGKPLRKISWDPLQGPPPRHDGTWDVCLTPVNQWATLEMAHRWLQQAPHDFKSLSLDSITEAQRRLKANITPSSLLTGYEHWGALLVKMDTLIRGFRDLVLLPNSLQVVIFIAETRLENGKYRPYMQGAISTSLPYWVDVVGYLYPENEADADGSNTRRVQKLLIGPHPSFETGERVQGKLPAIVVDPNIETMFNTIFQTQPNPTQGVIT